MPPSEQIHDFAVVGAGIAGASVAWELAAFGSVLVLERESQPGYHTTGRSAALYSATYGTLLIQALTRASRAFYDEPPAEFGTSAPILTPRGVVYVARPDQLGLLEAMLADARQRNPGVRRLGRDELLAQVPCLRHEVVAAGMSEPGAADIDVHALHQGYLRGLRRRGALLRTDAEVVALQPRGEGWQLRLADGTQLQARAVVNAAGAWADELARLAGVPPIGLEPRRRTAFTFAPPAGAEIGGWPAVIGVAEDFYFKPDAGQLLGSPANADPVAPHDVVPEELDVALGIHRIQEIADLEIRRPTRSWAGLRSFVADGDLVIGWDNHVPGFFWLAAQGGYGIQSAAAAALLARNLALNQPLDPRLVREGLEAGQLSPARLR
ncbi:D-arginine dehydrogenase [Melaminivora alkalimesophila]|uniref:D-arginine dehydrogenase n=3 Tax=Melaminivora alkalimesophila TaxID=1165852 RepID=A0A317RDQ6_9BURK|nr:FAD-dependent oxidoreductase [Melaminivora alkalimesophila]PWW44673.1 D-arginine dehydrogenase [Melaminivora alkalimesophila]